MSHRRSFLRHVIGATERPVKPQEVLATIFQFLGIDPRHEFTNFVGRPLPILSHGTPMNELIG